MKLNLITNNKDEELVKEYLENNASEILAEKINKGTPFTKDGKPFINKKTLSGFFDYANKQARELAEKGKNYTHVSSNVVFGWAMHYFEEDSIEGKLYNSDGTEYVPSKPTYKPSTTTIPTVVKPEPKPQLSMFDMFNSDKPVETKKKDPYIVAEQIKEKYSNIPDDEPDEEDIKDAMDELYEPTVDDEIFEDTPKPVIKQEPKKQPSQSYLNYTHIQTQYPDCIIVYRMGDFYEILGQDAVGIASKLGLTITSKDCGLDERVPMIGFPYHIADKYISKLTDKGHKVAIVESLDNIKIREQKQEEKHWINDTTFIDNDGVVHEELKENSSMDSAVVAIIKNLLGDIITL